MNRIISKDLFVKEIKTKLKDELSLKSAMQVAVIEKVVLNCGLGEAKHHKNLVAASLKCLEMICGQKAVTTLAKVSVSGFKLREGMAIGAKVTLRGQKMYDFISRLTAVYIPRIKDFRGLSPKKFDGRGNYTLGINDMMVFPELSSDTINGVPGLSVTVVTSEKDDSHSLALLKALGFPFQNELRR